MATEPILLKHTEESVWADLKNNAIMLYHMEAKNY
jgi:hypothetical protein